MMFARCILSWVPDLRRQFRELSDLIVAITDPILKPFQMILPPRSTGNIDFSPMLAIFALQLVEQVLAGFLR